MSGENRSVLFEPVTVAGFDLPNRIVMAPMTRGFSPGGVPGQNVADYYRRRAEGGVGLIVTEGTWVPHASSSNNPNVPAFYGDEALAGWKRVAEAVHGVGGRIIPQLWHVGQFGDPGSPNADPDAPRTRQHGPSGMIGELGKEVEKLDVPATLDEIEEIIEAFAEAADSAKRLGFDGVELHGAHGYLIDQFFWSATNLRDDRYGGALLSERVRLAVDLVTKVRARVGPDFPIVMRLSQWKQQDYGARLAETAEELETLVTPLADAGVDMFHCSMRRFWEGEFGTDTNLAGWVKKLSGKPTIAVGSVTLKQDLLATLGGEQNAVASNLDKLCEMMERGDFDLVAIGRALIVDPQWPKKVRSGLEHELTPFSLELLGRLD